MSVSSLRICLMYVLSFLVCSVDKKKTVEILLRCADDIKKQIIIMSPVYLMNQLKGLASF